MTAFYNQSATTVNNLIQQVTLQNTRVAALQVRVRAITVVDPRQWVAYGSSIDNVTGDGWSSLGVATVLTP